MQTIKQKYGDAISIQAEVSDSKAVGDLFGKIDAAWGGIDILINNAGIDGPHALTSSFFPASANSCANVPPPAPVPTMMTS